MKKKLSILLVFLIIASMLAACGGDSAAPSSEAAAASEQALSASEEAGSLGVAQAADETTSRTANTVESHFLYFITVISTQKTLKRENQIKNQIKNQKPSSLSHQMKVVNVNLRPDMHVQD